MIRAIRGRCWSILEPWPTIPQLAAVIHILDIIIMQIAMLYHTLHILKTNILQLQPDLVMVVIKAICHQVSKGLTKPFSYVLFKSIAIVPL